MADISKINAVALANIAKLDAVTAANIAKVNGLVFSTAPAFVGLLDETYGSGAAAAYSTRRLASATTVLLRVRRDTGTGGAEDDDEADVAYDSNNELSLDSAISNASAGVTATTLGQFINVGTVNGTTYTNPDSLTVTASCLVDTWYDQAGSNDAEQATQGRQPQIHDGTVNTDLITENGKPAVDFNGSNLLLSSTTDTANNTITAHFVTTPHTQGTAPGIDIFGQYHSGNAPYNIWALETYTTNDLSASYSNGNSWSGNNSEHTFTVNDQVLFLAVYDTSNIIHSKNGSAITGTRAGSFNTQASPYFIGSFPASVGGTNSLDGYVQEAVIWPTAQSSTNRSGIEGNINAHFQIGNFPNPTSGLLATYTGAAAAYSVRQLANTAALSMRVRRDTAGGTGDDDEADVLFDFTLTDPTISLDSRINNASTGVASTTLGEFLNATGYTDVDSLGTVADGFCDTWYDQSGNGNDAEQTAFGNQPQIFDSASPTDLITENGKPALDCSFVVGRGFSSVPISITGTMTYSMVSFYDQSGGGGYTSNGTFKVSISNTTGTVSLNGGGNTAITDSNLVNDGSIHHMVRTTSSAGTLVLNTANVQSSSNTASGTASWNCGNYLGNRRVSDRTGHELQEFIVWPADQLTTNQSGIETNINDYFSIY